jgi:hypothetical protein
MSAHPFLTFCGVEEGMVRDHHSLGILLHTYRRVL